jgi:hypothetical protein
MKVNIRPFFAIIVAFIMSVASIYLANEIFSNYFSFGDIVVFSWLSVSLVILPFAMIFPISYFSLFLLKGESKALKIIEGYMGCFKWLCIILVSASIIFIVFYKIEMKGKGYLICKGIPSGWMPGTATKYVKSKELCYMRKD